MFKRLIVSLCLGFSFFTVSVARAETQNQQVKCLADNIYFEARGEPLKGKVAVANVVMNRMKQPDRFGSTPCAVVKQKIAGHYQFSWMRHKSPIKYPDTYQDCIHIAETVYNGHMQDVTNGSTFYHAAYVHPKGWSKYRLTMKIEGHLFYKG